MMNWREILSGKDFGLKYFNVNNYLNAGDFRSTG